MIVDCECSVKILDDNRNKRWNGIFEKDWIPTAGPMIFGVAEFVQGKNMHPYYILAVYRLTQSQKLIISKRNFEHFKVPFEKTLDELEKPNLTFPIIADDTLQFICSKHTRMMMFS